MAPTTKGGPRSVPDPDAEAYDAAMRRQRALNARREQAEQYLRSHPGDAESLIPVWGSAREAIADGLEGDAAGAALNGALAVSDLFLAGSAVKGVAKGAVFVAKAGTKRAAPYGWNGNVRKWMGEAGHLAKGQHGHHWAIPQNGRGKNVPDWIKNQPWNIKPMPSPEVHLRIHGASGGKPRYNPAQRYWYGTPAWSKVATGSAAGHPIAVATNRKAGS